MRQFCEINALRSRCAIWLRGRRARYHDVILVLYFAISLHFLATALCRPLRRDTARRCNCKKATGMAFGLASDLKNASLFTEEMSHFTGQRSSSAPHFIFLSIFNSRRADMPGFARVDDGRYFHFSRRTILRGDRGAVFRILSVDDSRSIGQSDFTQNTFTSTRVMEPISSIGLEIGATGINIYSLYPAGSKLVAKVNAE